MAAWKSANVGWYRPYRARRLMNFHSRSIRFRLGEYEGRYNSVIPNCDANA